MQELIIEGGPRSRTLQSLRELWSYRDTVLAFAERSLRLKYKQSILGIGWALIQPLTMLVIFIVALGRLSDVSGGGVPYAAFALSVLVPWTFLQGGVSYSAQALVNDAALIRKVYFPREVPVIGAQLTAVVDLGIGLALFALLGPVLGARISASWLLAIPLVLPLFALGAGVALLFAGLTVYFRDVRHAMPFVLQLWLFASPVAYPITVVPGRWRSLYAGLNPAVGILDAFRRVLGLGQPPDWQLLGISSLSTIVVLWISYRVFKAIEPAFADVV